MTSYFLFFETSFENMLKVFFAEPPSKQQQQQQQTLKPRYFFSSPAISQRFEAFRQHLTGRWSKLWENRNFQTTETELRRYDWTPDPQKHTFLKPKTRNHFWFSMIFQLSPGFVIIPWRVEFLSFIKATTIVGGFSPTHLKNMRTVKLDHFPR